MPSVLRVLARVRRWLLIHRRGLTALALAVLTWTALGTVHPPAPRTVALWVAARDLPSGQQLRASDLVRDDFLASTAPAAAVRDNALVLGRTLVTPLTRGEPLTTAQVLGSQHLAGLPGRSAIGLRIPDEAVADLVRAGDRVDLVATDPQHGSPPELLVHDAVVLTVPRSPAGAGTTAGSGRLVVFAVPAGDVEHIAAAGSALYLSVIWNR